jgi:hypothetical protein
LPNTLVLVQVFWDFPINTLLFLSHKMTAAQNTYHNKERIQVSKSSSRWWLSALRHTVHKTPMMMLFQPQQEDCICNTVQGVCTTQTFVPFCFGKSQSEVRGECWWRQGQQCHTCRAPALSSKTTWLCDSWPRFCCDLTAVAARRRFWLFWRCDVVTL